MRQRPKKREGKAKTDQYRYSADNGAKTGSRSLEDGPAAEKYKRENIDHRQPDRKRKGDEEVNEKSVERNGLATVERTIEKKSEGWAGRTRVIAQQYYSGDGPSEAVRRRTKRNIVSGKKTSSRMS